ncbi:MAG: hypothetical protein FJ304_02960 [Planctomycetes bacterium]|nr:hypothetical protein [Planctomycetota bacterium]
MRTGLFTALLLAMLVRGSLLAADDNKPPRVEFTRLIAHWAEYGDDDYLKFVEDAKPDVCQIGFYGGHFYGLAHTKEYKGYPAHFPVQGLKECGKWFEDRNAAIHKRGAKVIGHFNVTFLVGEPDGKNGPEGFFKFYRELWDEKELGPKPVKDPLDLIAKNADGTPMASKQYSIGQMREFTACLSNPHWRTVLKAWTKRAIGRGVDGLVANYFYRHACLCEHCVKGFRDYLGARFTAGELKDKFGIADLKAHKFTEIVGWHNPKDSTPFKREQLRWSQIMCKEAFDEVFVKYAKGLKPGFIVGQWNHLGDFGQISGDERCMLPGDKWGTNEDYLWYSTGGAACFTDLANGFLGEGTLQARYIRGAFDDKPYTLGKYESTRIRVAIAELAANGGAPMGFYTRFKDPEARKEIVRYYQFMAKYDDLYRANKPHAELLLLFPKTAVHDGKIEAVEEFKRVGRGLLDTHLLFDVLPDDIATAERRREYIGFFTPISHEKTLHSRDTGPRSKFDAPKTVRVSASVPAKGGEVTLHFVNYNRTEPKEPKSPGAGIKDEKPVAADGVKADFVLPKGAKVKKVIFATPEGEEQELKFEAKDGRVKFDVPKFLVYGIVRIVL